MSYPAYLGEVNFPPSAYPAEVRYINYETGKPVAGVTVVEDNARLRLFRTVRGVLVCTEISFADRTWMVIPPLYVCARCGHRTNNSTHVRYSYCSECKMSAVHEFGPQAPARGLDRFRWWRASG